MQNIFLHAIFAVSASGSRLRFFPHQYSLRGDNSELDMIWCSEVVDGRISWNLQLLHMMGCDLMSKHRGNNILHICWTRRLFMLNFAAGPIHHSESPFLYCYLERRKHTTGTCAQHMYGSFTFGWFQWPGFLSGSKFVIGSQTFFHVRYRLPRDSKGCKLCVKCSIVR